MGEPAAERSPAAEEVRREVLSMADVYPPSTLAAIDRRARGRSRTSESGETRARSGGAGRLATGGLVAGLLLGVRDALEVEPDRPEVIDVDLHDVDAAEGVRLLLVPGAPELSRAWVRNT